MNQPPAFFYLRQRGDLFEARISSALPVNAWEGRLVLPEDLQLVNISYGAGIGDVWQHPPSLSGRYIDFAGGATAGFSGDGVLFSFTAVSPVRPAQLVNFDAARTALYAADGKGTPVAAELRPLTINADDLRLATSSAAAPDVDAPEPFAIQILKDEWIFGGKEAAVFMAQDFGSGIDHYEIEEHTYRGVIAWHRAESPYLVHADTKVILVRAHDRAGNYRIETVRVRPDAMPVIGVVALIATVSVLLIGAVYLVYIWRRRRSAARRFL